MIVWRWFCQMVLRPRLLSLRLLLVPVALLLNPAYRATELRSSARLEACGSHPTRANSFRRWRSGGGIGHPGYPPFSRDPQRSRPFQSRDPRLGERAQGFAQSDDVAILMQTSGTTSRPKLVPLTHANLLASARNNTATLQLSEADRYLNIMPLFHIHALLLILGTLLSGGSVIAAPTYESGQFFEWLD